MNDYSRQDLAALKSQVDLVEVVRLSGLELKAVGKNLLARCPFHDDDEASLSVNPETQLWNCFGCEAGGDVLNFLQTREGLSFPAALEKLKSLSGQVSAPVRARRAKAVDVEKQAPLLGRVAEIYASGFKRSKKAQSYLASRGLGSPEMQKAFNIGFADGSLLDMIPSEGEVYEGLKAVGLLRDDGREHFRDAVVVPLTHPDLGVLGFYGRRLGNKYKVRHLFLPGPRRGVLNWQALKRGSEVVVTESVFDALSLWVAGIKDVTCLFGVSSVPTDLAAALERYRVSDVTLFLDGDKAGREASKARARDLAKLHIKTHSVLLPDGADPNEILLTDGGAEELNKYLRRAVLLSEPTGPAFSVEEDGEGFSVCFGETSYKVVLKAPGSGNLKVSVKAEKDGVTFLNSLDLESHRARTSTINQVTRRLRLPKAEVENHFSRLVDEASKFADSASEEQGAQMLDLRQAAPELTEVERSEAIAFLSRPDLVETILGDMESLGYVGEEKAKLLAYLIGLSRKLEKPLAGIISSQSSSGKSGMTEIVEITTPPEEVVLFSRLSTHALGYLPKDFLKHKLLIIEERVGGEAADYSIRVLQSKQKLSQAVAMKDPATGQIQTKLFEVEGPIAYLETTTSSRINHENATRCFEIALDETEEQTQKIHKIQRESRTLEKFRSHSFRDLIKARHHNAQRLLEPVVVIIPFVNELRFPSRWLRTRRDHERFLCLIEVATFLHQYQRKSGTILDETNTEVSYVEATFDDYCLAYELAQDVLRSTLHELSKPARDLWGEVLAMIGTDVEKPQTVGFTRREVRNATQWPDKRLRSALSELVDMEYLAVDSGSQGRAYQYRVLANPNESAPACLDELTTPSELKKLLAEGALAEGELVSC